MKTRVRVQSERCIELRTPAHNVTCHHLTLMTTDCSVHPVRAVLAGHGHGLGGGGGSWSGDMRQHGEEASIYSDTNNNHGVARCTCSPLW